MANETENLLRASSSPPGRAGGSPFEVVEVFSGGILCANSASYYIVGAEFKGHRTNKGESSRLTYWHKLDDESNNSRDVSRGTGNFQPPVTGSSSDEFRVHHRVGTGGAKKGTSEDSEANATMHL
ncbi:hypothetical protein E1B28_009604 [Marasmius oreades]|uniref:Uncharacterized protein n=1 Tax=Marasmius oreades TaxID=181124 RepID=A0A9P7RVD9_9AGAR|nr:uncharacterized protein E1B28_009604 [Marasmius oreades]KAG7090491.1 hypothetical protein E1B28_009604 [Marasmius oreades]